VAIRLQFISLVIPLATLERVGLRELGHAQSPDDMRWRDAHLCRVDGAMNWPDVDEMVARWEAHGLQGLVGAASHQWWKDFAICASRRGPTFPCDWLEYDASENCVYLSGTARGEIQGPALLS
jgi:hypothetical protein